MASSVLISSKTLGGVRLLLRGMVTTSQLWVLLWRLGGFLEESIWTREKGRTSRAEARERRKQKSYWGLVWGEVFSVTTMTMSGFYKGALVFSALAGFALAFLCPPPSRSPRALDRTTCSLTPHRKVRAQTGCARAAGGERNGAELRRLVG